MQITNKTANVQYCEICKSYHTFDTYMDNEVKLFHEFNGEIGSNHKIGISPTDRAIKIMEQFNNYCDRKYAEINQLLEEEFSAHGYNADLFNDIRFNIKQIKIENLSDYK